MNVVQSNSSKERDAFSFGDSSTSLTREVRAVSCKGLGCWMGDGSMITNLGLGTNYSFFIGVFISIFYMSSSSSSSSSFSLITFTFILLMGLEDSCGLGVSLCLASPSPLRSYSSVLTCDKDLDD